MKLKSSRTAFVPMFAALLFTIAFAGCRTRGLVNDLPEGRLAIDVTTLNESGTSPEATLASAYDAISDLSSKRLSGYVDGQAEASYANDFGVAKLYKKFAEGQAVVITEKTKESDSMTSFTLASKNGSITKDIVSVSIVCQREWIGAVEGPIKGGQFCQIVQIREL